MYFEFSESFMIYSASPIMREFNFMDHYLCAKNVFRRTLESIKSREEIVEYS